MRAVILIANFLMFCFGLSLCFAKGPVLGPAGTLVLMLVLFTPVLNIGYLTSFYKRDAESINGGNLALACNATIVLALIVMISLFNPSLPLKIVILLMMANAVGSAFYISRFKGVAEKSVLTTAPDVAPVIPVTAPTQLAEPIVTQPRSPVRDMMVGAALTLFALLVLYGFMNKPFRFTDEALQHQVILICAAASVVLVTALAFLPGDRRGLSIVKVVLSCFIFMFMFYVAFVQGALVFWTEKTSKQSFAVANVVKQTGKHAASKNFCLKASGAQTLPRFEKICGVKNETFNTMPETPFAVLLVVRRTSIGYIVEGLVTPKNPRPKNNIKNFLKSPERIPHNPHQAHVPLA